MRRDHSPTRVTIRVTIYLTVTKQAYYVDSYRSQHPITLQTGQTNT